jgi:hypothetical protein
MPGELLCPCLPGEVCNEGICVLGDCAPISGQCESEFDHFCDEGLNCNPGTDPFDCCAVWQNNVCEENGMGGNCPKGSDYWDCGYCPFMNDGNCDEGFDCPNGSDGEDCCATQQNGVCEEQSQGGMCPDGSDPWDCGFCPFDADGFCDEPDPCPPGSDSDCCATQENGVCEEIDQGGMCPEGTDSWDCGECPFTNDGACDEPDLCPPGSDKDDCCAIPENGVCEELGQGGQCPDGSDFFDCGECPYTNDFFCDEPNLCPPGSDVADCCATSENGVCEEVGQGGQCPDLSDYYDCGQCPWPDDGFCDEPFLCPPGSDNDCV